MIMINMITCMQIHTALKCNLQVTAILLFQECSFSCHLHLFASLNYLGRGGTQRLAPFYIPFISGCVAGNTAVMGARPLDGICARYAHHCTSLYEYTAQAFIINLCLYVIHSEQGY